jgi:hypothetical protein
MDLEKLKEGDVPEWNAAFRQLQGKAMAALAPFRDSLIGGDLDLLAAEAISQLMVDRLKIKSQAHLLGSLVVRAQHIAKAALRALQASKRGGGKVSSLEDAHGASGFDAEDERADTRALVGTAELVMLVRGHKNQISPDDWSLLWDALVERKTHKVIAAEKGWGESSVGSRINQAKTRVKVVLSKNPGLAEVVKALDLKIAKT